MSNNSERDNMMLAKGYVPANVCARWGHYNVSSIHRAVDNGAMVGTRVQRRLYVEWASFRAYVGPLADAMPLEAETAMEMEP